MKKIFGIILLVFVFAGCEATDMLMGWHNPFVGKWTLKDSSQEKQVMTFRKDYIFELDREGDGTKDVWGTYALFFDQRLTIDNEGGDIENDCHQPGSYYYKFSGKGLKIFMIGDECSSRRESLGSAWQKIPRN